MGGWIKVHRRLINHWLWCDPEYLKAWIDLLFFAQYEPGKRIVNGRIVELNRGEFIGSSRFFAVRWGWGRTKIHTFFSLLKTDQMLIENRASNHTTYLIANFAEYQTNCSNVDDCRASNHTTAVPLTVPEPCQSRAKEKKVKKLKKKESNYTPIFSGCEFFRCSEEEYKQAAEIYRKRNLSLLALSAAPQIIDDWLAGETPAAKAARTATSHWRRLYASWVVDRALSDTNGPGSANVASRGMTAAEADRKVAEMNAQLAAKNLQKQGINIGALTKNVRNQTRGKSLDRERERRRSDLRNQILLESGSGVQGTVSKIS